jgi:glycosyltransferase involved in cell wall biosynthesis
MLVSAYIPYYNNASTLKEVIESLRAQTHPLQEILVIDDGSLPPLSLEPELGIRVIRHEMNLGRGAVRSRAMTECQQEYVLCCDATNILPCDFLEKALGWFTDPQVGAVMGSMSQPPATSLAHRWRGRHLFKMRTVTSSTPHSATRSVVHKAVLATYGALVRRSVVLEVGNYNPELRHSEDAELGSRILAAGYDVVLDRQLKVISIAENTLAQVLERYWRWYAGKDEDISFAKYWKLIGHSLKVLVVLDWQEQDPLSIPISLFVPHYQFWRSWWRKQRGKTQALQGSLTSDFSPPV